MDKFYNEEKMLKKVKKISQELFNFIPLDTHKNYGNIVVDRETALQALNMLDDVAHGRKCPIEPHWLKVAVECYIRSVNKDECETLNNARDIMNYIDTSKYTISALTCESKYVKISIDGYLWVTCPIKKSDLDFILSNVVL